MNSKLSKIDNLITEDLNTPLELEFQDNIILLDDISIDLASQNIDNSQELLAVKLRMIFYGKI